MTQETNTSFDPSGDAASAVIIDSRKHQRIQIDMPARIEFENGVIQSGRTVDVSFAGVCVEFPDIEGKGRAGRATVQLMLEGGGPAEVLEIQGRIAWSKGTRVGVSFSSISADHYPHLRNLILLNCPDPEALLEELQQHPGLAVDGP